MILLVSSYGQAHLGGCFAGLGWAHSHSRVSSCLCSPSAFNGLTYVIWLLAGVRGYQGHVSFIIQRASLPHSSGGIRVPSAARIHSIRVSTCIVFALIPLAKASDLGKPKVSIGGD